MGLIQLESKGSVCRRSTRRYWHAAQRTATLALAAVLAACGPADAAQTSTPSGTASATPVIRMMDITTSPSPGPTPGVTPTPDGSEVIGVSVENRPIQLYRFGQGQPKLLLIGGIHGGYEANTVALAYAVIDHYRNDSSSLTGVSLLIVPDANPDGVAALGRAGGRAAPGDSGALADLQGRVNANGVDLNRNWDCNWKPTGVWAEGKINGGAWAFSEPEARALRDLILAERPAVVVFWHSALGAVFSGGCGSRSVFDASKSLVRVYAQAAGYQYGEAYGGYPVTGDASNWVAGQGIPALTVELTTHDATELAQNLAGVEAVIATLGARMLMSGRR